VVGRASEVRSEVARTRHAPSLLMSTDALEESEEAWREALEVDEVALNGGRTGRMMLS
jgi:hypothetical protein